MYRLILIFTILLSSIALNAQNFRLGFQASPHLTWMNSSKATIENNELRPGIKYGLEADFYLAGFPRYSLNTGLFVANHSFTAVYDVEETFSINDVAFDERVLIAFKMNYIEIPLNIKLKSDEFYRMKFYGQFGLSNLFNLSASATSSNSEFAGDKVNNGLQNSTITVYNLNMLMGGGIEYDLGGNTALNLGFQYSNGLIDITQIDDLSEKTVMNSARIVLGILF